jgi:hypothetical protein
MSDLYGKRISRAIISYIRSDCHHGRILTQLPDFNTICACCLNIQRLFLSWWFMIVLIYRVTDFCCVQWLYKGTALISSHGNLYALMRSNLPNQCIQCVSGELEKWNAFRERNESEIRGWIAFRPQFTIPVRLYYSWTASDPVSCSKDDLSADGRKNLVRLIILHASHSLNAHLIICIPAEAGIKKSDPNPTRLNIFCILGVWQENATWQEIQVFWRWFSTLSGNQDTKVLLCCILQ